jgi:hypothetical protein
MAETSYVAKTTYKDRYQQKWSIYDNKDRYVGKILKYKIRSNYQIYLYHPEIYGLYIKGSEFQDMSEMLSWARKEIDAFETYPIDFFRERLKSLKEERYQTEMSDDFAYSNGKIAEIDKQISGVLRKIGSFE